MSTVYSDSQPKEPLMPHELVNRPWEKVGIDICSIENDNYLITVDYFSNFTEIDYLPGQKSSTVIHKLKMQFARHGIPDICFTYKGPCFVSDEFKAFSKL